MRSMTGYGRGQSAHDGTKYSVELNSVNGSVELTIPSRVDAVLAGNMI